MGTLLGNKTSRYGFNVRVQKPTRLQFSLLCLNSILWIWFWAQVFQLPHQYENTQLEPPMFRAFGHADPWPGLGSFRFVTRIAVVPNLPTFALVRVAGFAVPNSVALSIRGFDFVGLRVLWTTALSFLQWYWLARLIEWGAAKLTTNAKRGIES